MLVMQKLCRAVLADIRCGQTGVRRPGQNGWAWKSERCDAQNKWLHARCRFSLDDIIMHWRQLPTCRCCTSGSFQHNASAWLLVLWTEQQFVLAPLMRCACQAFRRKPNNFNVTSLSQGIEILFRRPLCEHLLLIAKWEGSIKNDISFKNIQLAPLSRRHPRVTIMNERTSTFPKQHVSLSHHGSIFHARCPLLG